MIGTKVNAELFKSLLLALYLLVAFQVVHMRAGVMDVDMLFQFSVYAVVSYIAITLFIDGLYLAEMGGFKDIFNEKQSKAEKKLIAASLIHFIIGFLLFIVVTWLMIRDVVIILDLNKSKTGFGKKKLRMRRRSR